MNLGVIGVRSKHLAFFRSALKQLPDWDAKITHVCGYDAPEKLADWSDLTVCDSAEALMRESDAVIIALREGTQHAALAQRAMELGKPVFVDKPFTCTVEDAEAICRCAAATGVACTGGSTLCTIPDVRRLAAAMPPSAHYSLSYQADPFEPYGGWYFYGSHLTDLCATLFGCGFTAVHASLRGDRVQAEVAYPNFTVSLCSSPEVQPLVLRAGQDTYFLDDTACYRFGLEHFFNVIAGNEGGRLPQLAASVRLMHMILTSLRG